MGRTYEQMSQTELVGIARKKGVRIPLQLSSLKGVAEPSLADERARHDLINQLNMYDIKKQTNWGRVGAITGIAALILSAIAIFITLVL